MNTGLRYIEPTKCCKVNSTSVMHMYAQDSMWEQFVKHFMTLQTGHKLQKKTIKHQRFVSLCETTANCRGDNMEPFFTNFVNAKEGGLTISKSPLIVPTNYPWSFWKVTNINTTAKWLQKLNAMSPECLKQQCKVLSAVLLPFTNTRRPAECVTQM